MTDHIRLIITTIGFATGAAAALAIFYLRESIKHKPIKGGAPLPKPSPTPLNPTTTDNRTLSYLIRCPQCDVLLQITTSTVTEIKPIQAPKRNNPGNIPQRTRLTNELPEHWKSNPTTVSKMLPNRRYHIRSSPLYRTLPGTRTKGRRPKDHVSPSLTKN